MSVIPPPPPPQRSGDNCMKYGVITCGALGCIGAVGIAIIMYFAFQSPVVKQAMGAVFQAQAATQQLKTVGSAIDRYVADKSRYPNHLKDLVPTYVPNEDSFRVSPQDPKSPQIWYKKPAKDAPPETLILQTKLLPPIPLPDAPPWEMSLRKDGQVDGMEYVYTDPSGEKHRVNVRGLQ